MKFKIPKLDKLLSDKNVLYVVFVLAILNILGYLLVQNTEAVAFFLIVGFLTTYFSKNMIIVLIVAMVTTSLFTATRRTIVMKESMSNKSDEASSEDKDEAKSKIKKDKQEIKQKVNDNKSGSNNNDTDDDNKSDTKMSNGKHRVDLVSTLNEAYGNLQKTVGEGGVKGLTDQTQNLLSQQKELMENITTMQPFLETAQGFMDKLDLSGLEGIGGMLSKLGVKNE
tara:strand:- start:1177 stop:1851 length:675 start_codon:yes stop_codon:yes gene_type:complete